MYHDTLTDDEFLLNHQVTEYTNRVRSIVHDRTGDEVRLTQREVGAVLLAWSNQEPAHTAARDITTTRSFEAR